MATYEQGVVQERCCSSAAECMPDLIAVESFAPVDVIGVALLEFAIVERVDYEFIGTL